MSLKIMTNTVLLLTSTSRLRITDVSALHVGGGGPTTKKTKDILRFSMRHDLL